MWKVLWASLVLNRRERKAFRELTGPDTRRSDWLLGRAAAKDAARVFLRRHYALVLGAADIEIDHDEYGRPVLGGPWTREAEALPTLSLAHAGGTAVALVGHAAGGRRLGIDLEAIRPLRPEFEAFAFTRDEQELLASLPSSSRPEWVFRFWCAKEALAKALGRGLMDGPKSIRVHGLDRETGIVAAVGHGRLVEARPEFAGRTLVVYTVREDDWVVATTLCEEQP